MSVKNAKSIVQFYFDNTLGLFDPAIPENKASIGRIVLPVIARIPSNIEKAHWVSALASVLKVGEQSVWQDLEHVTIESSVQSNTAPQKVTSQRTRMHQLKERLLGLLIQHPSLQEKFKGVYKEYLSQPNDEESQTVLDGLLLKLIEAETPLEQDQLLKSAVEEEKVLINTVLFADEAWGQGDYDSSQEYATLVSEWQKEEIRRRLKDLQYSISKAEQNKNEDLNTFIEERNKLIIQLSTLNA